MQFYNVTKVISSLVLYPEFVLLYSLYSVLRITDLFHQSSLSHYSRTRFFEGASHLPL
uniref:Uncharacterized protein n=1 Tax=Arundo donax TaxID=35708 RepID=A0A0A9FMK2_ARUDO